MAIFTYGPDENNNSVRCVDWDKIPKELLTYPQYVKDTFLRQKTGLSSVRDGRGDCTNIFRQKKLGNESDFQLVEGFFGGYHPTNYEVFTGYDLVREYEIHGAGRIGRRSGGATGVFDGSSLFTAGTQWFEGRYFGYITVLGASLLCIHRFVVGYTVENYQPFPSDVYDQMESIRSNVVSFEGLEYVTPLLLRLLQLPAPLAGFSDDSPDYMISNIPDISEHRLTVDHDTGLLVADEDAGWFRFPDLLMATLEWVQRIYQYFRDNLTDLYETFSRELRNGFVPGTHKFLYNGHTIYERKDERFS